ncbi:MAG TPA: bifunctional [glutamate--ammonia ligase]-adenylyl-L-tyrosine phosphorylase/[glutamate--ammonia-ligase] adenylyltransferase [Steroidobacteraceae bacterium]|nr:bifunctional [glutamate--ammonia ligase]-adenylyl-L-tyrosine phosphorylase/[glutamate--ammonia-ligase] adenylyltransferase [Steroidobacteraceae bacterium]
MLPGFIASGELTALLQRATDALQANVAAAALESAATAVRESLPLVFAGSDFVAQACARDGMLLAALIERADLQRTLAPAEFATRAPTLSNLPEAEALSELRRWRRHEMVRIAWRDLAGWADLPETMSDLSAFADAAINIAVRYARQSLVARYGEPRSADGTVHPLVVLAMGKLGGGELNFSSDVDLVLLFPEHGETDGARSIANEEFFTRLAQAVIRLLEAPTHEGAVLRVDLRLRPFGDSGPLVASFASFEDYLPRHGREWERYAYVKARAVTAPEAYADLYASAVRPFVYRRYLDYGVFESLREMKALIEREVERRELADHVKLGPGGIREIEFIVQAFQIIRGGQDRRLQTPSLLAALALLDTWKRLPPGMAGELRAAYVFLRRLENRLQMIGDAQVHRLPDDSLTRERIALAMGAPDWTALVAELNRYREIVSRHFRLVVFGNTERDSGAVRIDLGRFWDTQAETAVLAESLARAGFAARDEAARLLLELRSSALVRKLDEPGRKRLQALLPPLLADVARVSPAGQAPASADGPAAGVPEAVTPAAETQLQVLRRVLRIIEAIGQRSTYFALLHENAAARERLVELCGHGDFLTQQIASHPLLLDELIDERLAELPSRVSLEDEARSRLEQLNDDDPERQVEALRHFQRVAIFRVAVADLTGRVPVMRVSDRLTEIAEIIIEHAIELGWRQIAAQFGVPMCGEGASRRPVSICVVGYGKLGGMELGYSSDLDLVFLHDSHGERQETQGARPGAALPIDNQLFFVRLAQRIMHLLTMHSAAGRLYEVDVRLRPSGKGGLLVTSITAFAEYQQREAWTWEHQALLHARAVAGASRLRADFESIRLEVLANHVKRETLRTEVRNMRERMRKELSKGAAGRFDIKQDAGGVADIEFLAQYWALLWAKDYPPVVLFSDTIRQLESVASADLVPQATVDVLTAAYRAFRGRSHHLSLAGAGAIVPDTEFVVERAAVTHIWNEAMGV